MTLWRWAAAGVVWISTLHAADNDVSAELAARLAAANPAQGKTVFFQCMACHTARAGEPATIGPNLWNVVGRPVAAQPGFAYSESLRQVGGVWDDATLDRYLLDPKSVAPEGRMLFAGIDSVTDRANLIAYMRTLIDAPSDAPNVAKVAPQSSSAQVAESGDQWQELPPGPGRDEVFYLCKGCHSLMIVKQQALNRATWDDTLRWMVEKQGMPPINDAATRNRVLDYLAKHFGSD